MHSKISCELEYIESKHLSQLYAGLELLADSGKITVKLNKAVRKQQKPLLKMKVNESSIIIFDTLDGLNWIDGSEKENLKYLKENIIADYYFKRSFDNRIVENAPAGCTVLPLGLNYNISPRHLYKRNFRDALKNTLRNNRMLAGYFKINDSDLYYESFEENPGRKNSDQILFLTRLWDPAEVEQDHLKAERAAMNAYRTNCIRLCRKEFGPRFLGGIQEDGYSITQCKDLIIPHALTKRAFYLNTVKNSNICIATTGLHNSIGFKMGEYVAASRAIISEPLHYELPGNFKDGHNYYSFNNAAELVEKILLLTDNSSALEEMMNNNHLYYKKNLRPDVLVQNALNHVVGGI